MKGWKQPGILVRAKVPAETEAGARALGSQVRIDTAGSRVQAEGPSTRGREHWHVSYEIFVSVHLVDDRWDGYGLDTQTTSVSVR